LGVVGQLEAMGAREVALIGGEPREVELVRIRRPLADR
jgi:hypothetical protein